MDDADAEVLREAVLMSSIYLRAASFLYAWATMVNRGQRDIVTPKPIQQAFDAKRNFFEHHPAHQGKAQYYGTPFLARKLNMVCACCQMKTKLFDAGGLFRS